MKFETSVFIAEEGRPSIYKLIKTAIINTLLQRINQCKVSFELPSIDSRLESNDTT